MRSIYISDPVRWSVSKLKSLLIFHILMNIDGVNIIDIIDMHKIYNCINKQVVCAAIRLK